MRTGSMMLLSMTMMLMLVWMPVTDASAAGNDQDHGDGIPDVDRGQQNARKYRTALVTLANTQEYAMSAIILAKSFLATGSGLPDTELIMLSPKGSLDDVIQAWVGEYWKIVITPDTPFIDMKNSQRVDLNRLCPPKLYTWALTQYDRILYLDADSFVRKRLDFFFNDKYWMGNITGIKQLAVNADNFIGGTLLVKPGEEFYRGIMNMLYNDKIDYNNADQGLMNKFFHEEWVRKPEWQRIPVTAELTAAQCVLAHLYPKEFLDLFNTMTEVSFIFDFQGQNKPWTGWPRTFAYKSCEAIDAFAKVWMLIGLSSSIDQVRKLLIEFNDTKRKIPIATVRSVQNEFVKAFKEGRMNKDFALLLTRVAKDVYNIPLDPKSHGTLKKPEKEAEL